ncbi:hypothetical protein LINPERPRIM_LOCUS33366, partial [Linum perenne]
MTNCANRGLHVAILPKGLNLASTHIVFRFRGGKQKITCNTFQA